MSEKLSAAELICSFKEVKRKFRWILQIEGVDAFVVSSVKSLPGNMVEVRTSWPVDDKFPQFPKTNKGRLKFLAPDGKVTDDFELLFSGYDPLYFNLDYADPDAMKPGFVLKDVLVHRRE